MSFECLVCGAPLNVNGGKGGLVECAFCGRTMFVPSAEDSNTAFVAIKEGFRSLRNGEFNTAHQSFQEAKEWEKRNPDAYFGTALAEFRIQYVKNKEDYYPVCYVYGNDRLSESDVFKKAVYFAEEGQKEVYLAIAHEVDGIRENFEQLSSLNSSCDVYICVSTYIDNRETQDFETAKELRRHLIAKGYKVFLPEIDAVNHNISSPKERIMHAEAKLLHALYTAKSLVIVSKDGDIDRDRKAKSEYYRYYYLRTGGFSEASHPKDSIVTLSYGSLSLLAIGGGTKNISLLSPDYMTETENFIRACLGLNPLPQNIKPEIVTSGPIRQLGRPTVQTLIGEKDKAEKDSPHQEVSAAIDEKIATQYRPIRSKTLLEFGSYPQAMVKNLTLIENLTAISGVPFKDSGWNELEGFENRALFKDVDFEGNRYRGIYFTSYRPRRYGLTDNSRSRQIANNVRLNTLYWFAFKKIKWRVLFEENGIALVHSDIALDSQSFNADLDNNDWETSFLRSWLNTQFLTTAFNDKEMPFILSTLVDDGEDKIYLLSSEDVNNFDVSFSLSCSDYAKTSGCGLDGAKCFCWLRSPSQSNPDAVKCVSNRIVIKKTRQTEIGVMPAMQIALK